jgi:hypothetical protein
VRWTACNYKPRFGAMYGVRRPNCSRVWAPRQISDRL